jgi:hypothetical protein
MGRGWSGWIKNEKKMKIGYLMALIKQPENKHLLHDSTDE